MKKSRDVLYWIILPAWGGMLYGCYLIAGLDLAIALGVAGLAACGMLAVGRKLGDRLRRALDEPAETHADLGGGDGGT